MFHLFLKLGLGNDVRVFQIVSTMLIVLPLLVALLP